jgi:hypothetical protein
VISFLLAFIFLIVPSVVSGCILACNFYEPRLKEAKEQFRNVNQTRLDFEHQFQKLQNELNLSHKALDRRDKELQSLRKINKEMIVSVNCAKEFLSRVYPASEVSGRTIDHTGNDSQDNTGAS